MPFILAFLFVNAYIYISLLCSSNLWLYLPCFIASLHKYQLLVLAANFCCHSTESCLYLAWISTLHEGSEGVDRWQVPMVYRLAQRTLNPLGWVRFPVGSSLLFPRVIHQFTASFRFLWFWIDHYLYKTHNCT